VSDPGWRAHPHHPTTWAYWDGSRWLNPDEAVAAGQVLPHGFPPPSSPPPPGWWQASDGQWYPPHLHPTNPQATGGWYGHVAAPQSTNGLAIASMVLSIVWIYGIGSILALVFGYRSRRQIARSQGRQGGGGMAMAGIVLGWIGIVGLVLVVALVAVFGDVIDDGYNTDRPNGVCNSDRFWQDPDCE
jgi:hypothetical protein